MPDNSSDSDAQRADFEAASETASEPHQPDNSARGDDAPDGTTTHAAYGAGRPRLVLTGRGAPDPEHEEDFALTREVTRIGSAADDDLVLPGLAPHHATITHTAADEYVLDTVGDTVSPSAGEGSPTDDRAHAALLRSGAAFSIGDWGFAFQRDEYADHGRPYGGREGGELSSQPEQPAAPDYSHPHARASVAENATDRGVSRTDPVGDSPA